MDHIITIHNWDHYLYHRIYLRKKTSETTMPCSDDAPVTPFLKPRWLQRFSGGADFAPNYTCILSELYEDWCDLFVLSTYA